MHNFRNLSRVVYSIGRVGPGGVQLLGTAFNLNKEGHFATASHVVSGSDTGLVLVLRTFDFPDVNVYQDASDTSVRMVPLRILASDPFRDLAILVADVNLHTTHTIAGTDAAEVGTPLCSFGYPHADHGRLILTRQESSVGARILLSSGKIKSKHIVLNTLARPGQSGSPVFTRDDGQLIAVIVGAYIPESAGQVIVAGIDPNVLHQTTHAVSAEYLLEMY
ncbi:S1 family peptidase [Cupriavidus nantongensis]|uniref:S1 family peptidase n=1 Tax=Cupriavidus nantongensis TaxID=1796606 RepID=UPI0009EE3179|nr:serine protease [Cupriavidus nantongensis]